MKPNRNPNLRKVIPYLRVVRLIFILLITALTFQWARVINPFIQPADTFNYAFTGMVVAIGLVLIESQIQNAFPQELVVGLFGMICGLMTSALIQIALPQSLPKEQEQVIRLGLHLFLGYFGITMALRYAHRFDFSATKFLTRSEDRLYGAKILDTSVLVDGRILEIAEAGFMGGLVLIPSFVINEMQTLSDSEDYLKRSKGRRGLDISKRLQHSSRCEVEIYAEDFPNLIGVDKKILALAKKYDCTLVTMDFNLGKVAEIEEVPIMNINQLAQSLKTVVLPGEDLTVQIIREGKEANQGVGYLDDGTMVVVENARRLMGKHLEVAVISVLQTSAGRMIFTRLKDLEARTEKSA